MKTILSLLAIVLLSTGCTGTAKVVKAMGNDKVPSMLRVSSVYGTVTYIRLGNATNFTANPDGTITAK